MTEWRRLPVLGLGGVALVAGLLAGEARLGWDGPAAGLAELHGPLMVSAFFGTVIGLERAVALKQVWGYGAPVLTGLGGLALLAGWPAVGALLLALGSLLFVAMAAVAMRRQPALFTLVLACGAVSWLAGDLVWLGGAAVPEVTGWWLFFLVLTIVGERLELSRFAPPLRGRETIAAGLVALALAAPAAGWAEPSWRWPALGGVLAGLAVWLAVIDVARRTVRQPGLARFVAVCLLSGYVWLGLGGVLAVIMDVQPAGFAYDAVLHAVFVGFVFAMVFGHAPIILPAVLRVSLPFTRSLYLPLILLHVSLALRVAGDLAESQNCRLWGGLLNGLVIAGWFVFTAVLVIAAGRRAGRRPRPHSSALSLS